MLCRWFASRWEGRLLEIPPENCSFGEGQAQFADQLPPQLAPMGPA
jgi:hypothetical protein